MDDLGRRAMDLFGVGLTADDLAHGVVDGMLSCDATPDGGRLAVAYVAWDDYPPAALHDGSDGRGRVIQVDGDERGERLAREFAASAAAAGHRVHEAPLAEPAKASPLGTVPGPRLVHAGLGHDARGAGDELAAHVAWRSGELCGIVVEVFAPDGEGGLVSVDHVAEWPRLAKHEAFALLPDAIAPRVSAGGPAFR